jgi:hypothetical protein
MLNSGPPKELAILKEYAGSVEPEIVFWMFYEGNDHEGLAFEKNSSLYLKYLENGFSQNLMNRQMLVDSILIKHLEKEFARAGENMQIALKAREEKKKKEEAAFKISLSSLKLTQLRKRLGMLQNCESDVDLLFRDIMTEAKNTVGSWSGQIVFVYLPAWSRYPEKVNRCRKRFLDSGKNGVISVIEDLQIPIIDMQRVFDSHPDPLSLFSFRLNSHYNSRGYALVAEHINKHLATHRGI